MATKQKMTADTTADEATGVLPASLTLTAAGKLLTSLTAVEDAILVRSFERTLSVKRRAGEVLSLVVTSARTAAGADASKVGKVGDAVTFANIGHALGVTGSDWSFGGRTRSTLSDDHDANLYATPDAVRQFRTADAPTFTNGKSASRDNVQHAIRWCKQQQSTTTSNRAAGADDVNGPRVVVTSDDRVAIATALAAANGAGGEAVTMRVTAPTVVAQLSALPDFVTPAWLAAISDAGLAALVLAVEGERKRRSVASKGKGTTSTPAPDAPAPDTADVVAALQEQMANMAAVMASLVK